MIYDRYDYLWPPRPEKAIPLPMLSYYEKRGWIAQAKMNGTCSVIAVSPDKKLTTANRHHEDHKLWTPTPASSAAFKELPGKGWFVFVAELMHSKVPGLRDINYINDVLVADGEYLVGKTFAQRQDILQKLFLKGKEPESLSHYVINENTWLAKNRTSGFADYYNKLNRLEHEGLVLKNPEAKLELCIRPSSNAGWSVKCRRKHKNYSF